ncbi:transcription termination factor NusA [Streptobacillus moniliformis]|uniref:transcription termination factor NusA n=1 Tax=Streptobacillus moniliformis TaxID=34105 RepID=UPI0007E338A7|nr:transcription termination factor NusA [Streptobacillus moniliformis]QXW65988.1 transcription termination factor NusA [Streptobacillus moniliformis]
MKSKDKATFLDAIEELEKEKGIQKGDLLERLKTGLLAAYKKDFNDQENLEIEIDQITGDVKMFCEKLIIDDEVKVYNETTEIPFSKAKNHRKRIKVGDYLKIELNADEFNRNAIQRAKSIIIQYIREQEKELICKQLTAIEHQIVNVIVRRIEENGSLYVGMNGLDLIIPQRELSSLDKIQVGDRLVAYIRSVDTNGRFPKVDITRIDDKLIHKLFEREVPEIASGIIVIKNIAREVGVKAKVAIYSEDPNIDLKGSCIGKDGVRINNIINELNGEKIELVEWNADQRIFVKNALYPAEIFSVEIVRNEDEIVAKVEVDPSQLTLAIGKKGVNSKLAGKLCKLRVNIEASDEVGEEEREEQE